MKPKTKTPAKKREQKKHINLVIPEKIVDQAEASAQIVTQLEPEVVSTPQPELEREPAQTPAKTKKTRAAHKDDHSQVAAQIADDLSETKSWPRLQIKHIVWALGAHQAQELARKAREIDTTGGMLTLSGEHRRTVGGIFFFLAYTEGKPRPGKVLTRPSLKKRHSATPEAAQPAQAND